MEAAQATLNKTLEKILDDLEYKERDVEIVPVSSNGANYTTTLFEITVTGHTSNKPTLELFAKVANVNEAIRKQMGDGPNSSLYFQEYRVYEELRGLYGKIEEKHNVPLEHRYVFPKLYSANMTFGEETFVMENLTKRGFHIFNRFSALDWEHAAVSIKDLAKFHALSLALEKEHPEAFEKLASNKMPQIDAFEAMIKQKIIDNVELVQEEYKTRLHQYLAANTDYMDLIYNPRGKKVLVDGDFKTSNILYKRQAGKLIAVTVDYQGVRLGNPFQDFQYFLATGSDEKFRKHYYNQLVDYYYSEMGLALKRLGLDISEEYPRSLFDEDHKLYLPSCLILTLTLLPVILVSEEEAPDMADTATDINNFHVKSSEQYKERLQGYIRDFASMAVSKELFKMEKALFTLNKNLEKILDDLEYKERHFKVVPVSSGGANYTTTLFEITVTCPGKPTLELFAKVGILSEALRKQMSDDANKSLYYKKYRVYEKLVGLYNKMEEKHNVPLQHRYLFAKLYGADTTFGEETFVMENLIKQKFHLFSRFKSLDWEHAAVSIRDLAKFHALSMALQKEYPEAYESFASTKMPEIEGFEEMIKAKMIENIELAPEEYKARLQISLLKIFIL